MNMNYFGYLDGLVMTNYKMAELFDGPPRAMESEITQREMDIAKSIQVVTEELVMKMAHHAKKITGENNLVLAGGVALNCVSNGKLLRDGPFENIWIQPAAGDAGGSLGAALMAWHHYYEKPRTVNPQDSMQGSYLGPGFDDDETAAWLAENGYPAERLEGDAWSKRIAKTSTMKK